MELNIRVLAIGDEVAQLGEVMDCPTCHQPGILYEGADFTCVLHQCRIGEHRIELIEGCLLHFAVIRASEGKPPRKW